MQERIEYKPSYLITIFEIIGSLKANFKQLMKKEKRIPEGILFIYLFMLN